MAQLKELEQTLNRIAGLVQNWKDGRFVIRRESFDTRSLQRNLEEKLRRFDKQLPQKLN